MNNINVYAKRALLLMPLPLSYAGAWFAVHRGNWTVGTFLIFCAGALFIGLVPYPKRLP